MLDKEYLIKEGFVLDYTAPSSVTDYERRTAKGYVRVRFEGETATGLYAYTEGPKNNNMRKVVLTSTIVTKEDLETAIKLCKLC